jgi:hypothetical protein
MATSRETVAGGCDGKNTWRDLYRHRVLFRWNAVACGCHCRNRHGLGEERHRPSGHRAEDRELKKADRAMKRRQRLYKIFNDRFNYEEMSKRALGAQWNNLNETQRQQFVDLFRQLLARTYTGTIEGCSGERFQYLNEHNEGNYAEVRTQLISRKGEIPINYRLLSKSGEWQVYDIVVDGSVWSATIVRSSQRLFGPRRTTWFRSYKTSPTSSSP